MLYLMQEEGFVQFPWCQRTLRGLWDEVRRKRTARWRRALTRSC